MLVLVSSEQRALNLQTLLREQKVTSGVEFSPKTLPKPGQIMLTVGGLSGGMEYPDLKLAVVTEGQAAPQKRPQHKKEATNRQKLKSYADLSPGDLVVHEHHGVGRYVGMVKMPADGIEKDYVKIAYAGSDVLYVPATQLGLISKYIGGGEDATRPRSVSKLGGTDWERAKSKAKKAVQDLAKGLIELYAQRQRQPGYAFSPDSPGSGSLRSSLSTPRRRTSCGASRKSRRIWSPPCPWTGCCAATWATARRRWPSGP